MAKYTKFNGRRKPELLEPGTYSLVDYGEAEKVFTDFQELTAKAEEIYGKLPENQRDAFFELVLYPTKASAIVTELYITAGKNQLYANQGRTSANDLAAQARALFQQDAELTAYYNRTLAHGKWDHMMDQTHIGYTFWNQPPANAMPAVSEIQIAPTAADGCGDRRFSVGLAECSRSNRFCRHLTFSISSAVTLTCSIGVRGTFEFSLAASAPWIMLSESKGTIDKDRRIWVSVDWSKVPEGSTSGQVKVSGTGAQDVIVKMNAFRPIEPTRDSLDGFVEGDRYVSIEATHFTRKIDAVSARWEEINDLGRTLSSMSVFPVTAESAAPPQNSPHLEYKMYLFDAGPVEVEAILAPTLNFVPGRGLRYAVSFDDQPPQIIDALANHSQKDWEETVKDGVRKVKSKHTVAQPGYHTLKFWMVDPGVVLQKLVVNLGGVKPSYLGPPESYRHDSSATTPH